MKNGLALIMALALSLFEILMSTGAGADGAVTSFDIQGTITNVLTPSSILVGKETVSLADVDPSGLNAATYEYLMQDIRD